MVLPSGLTEKIYYTKALNNLSNYLFFSITLLIFMLCYVKNLCFDSSCLVLHIYRGRSGAIFNLKTLLQALF